MLRRAATGDFGSASTLFDEAGNNGHARRKNSWDELIHGSSNGSGLELSGSFRSGVSPVEAGAAFKALLKKLEEEHCRDIHRAVSFLICENEALNKKLAVAVSVRPPPNPPHGAHASSPPMAPRSSGGDGSASIYESEGAQSALHLAVSPPPMPTVTPAAPLEEQASLALCTPTLSTLEVPDQVGADGAKISEQRRSATEQELDALVMSLGVLNSGKVQNSNNDDMKLPNMPDHDEPLAEGDSRLSSKGGSVVDRPGPPVAVGAPVGPALTLDSESGSLVPRAPGSGGALAHFTSGDGTETAPPMGLRMSVSGGLIFPMRELWMAKVPKPGGQRRRISNSHTNRIRQSIHNRAALLDATGQTSVKPTHGLRRLIIKPGSRRRLAWDLFGGVLILYDLVNIPLGVFNPPEVPFTTFMGWLTLLYWTINIVVSFFVGFVKNGDTVLDPSKISANYLMGWFWIDLIVVVPDWTFTFLKWMSQSETENGGPSRDAIGLVRILRLARTIRLLRLLKLGWILTIINDLLDSEAASIIANIIKMILTLLGINHFIACVWFFVGDVRLQEDDENNWITYYGFDKVEWEYQYLTSFHWSITQFTPASMNVNPVNTVERLLTICVVVFALVGFSYLVGSITGSLTQLRGMKEEAAKEFWKLRRYLKRNSVDFELSMRIQRYLEHEYHRQMEGSTPNKVKLLNVLSEQLHNELQYAMAVPHVQVHPLFTVLGQVSEVVLQRLAKGAITAMHFARGDPVFIATETATSCYFVVSGRLQYSRQDAEGREHQEWVDKGEDWVAEPVLWTPKWIHLGVLIATLAQNHMLTVDATKFGEIISKTPSALRMVQNYAKNFLMHLNSTPDEDLSDVSQGENIGERIKDFITTGNPELAEHLGYGDKSSEAALSAADEVSTRREDLGFLCARWFWRVRAHLTT